MPTKNILKQSGTAGMDNLPNAAGLIYDTADGFPKYDDSGTARVLVDTAKTQTITGTKTFSGAVAFTGTTTSTQDGTPLGYTEVVLTSAQVKALRATPITLVAAPAAGKALRFVAAELILDYGGSNGFTESTNNLAVRYTGTTGVIVSGTIEMTGFIDQTADTATGAIPVIDGIVAKAGLDAQALVLHNTSGAEIAGNAAADNVVRVKTWYAVISTGW